VSNLQHYPLFDKDFIPLLAVVVLIAVVALAMCVSEGLAIRRRMRKGYSLAEVEEDPDETVEVPGPSHLQVPRPHHLNRKVS